MSASRRWERQEAFLWWVRSKPRATVKAPAPAVSPTLDARRAVGRPETSAVPSADPRMPRRQDPDSGGATGEGVSLGVLQRFFLPGSLAGEVLERGGLTGEVAAEFKELATALKELMSITSSSATDPRRLTEVLRAVSRRAYQLAYRSDGDFRSLPEDFARAVNSRLFPQRDWQVTAITPTWYSDAVAGMEFPAGASKCRPLSFVVRGPSGTQPAESEAR